MRSFFKDEISLTGNPSTSISGNVFLALLTAIIKHTKAAFRLAKKKTQRLLQKDAPSFLRRRSIIFSGSFRFG